MGPELLIFAVRPLVRTTALVVSVYERPTHDLALLCRLLEAHSANHDYVRVAKVWARISKLCRKRGIDAVACLQKLGRNTPDQALAERFLRSALALQELSHPPSSPQLIPTLQLLVETLHLRGDFDNAVAFARRILSIRAAAFGEDDLGAAKEHNIIGVMLAKRGLREQALWSFRRALEIREKDVHCNQKNLALYMSNLPRYLRRRIG